MHIGAQKSGRGISETRLSSLLLKQSDGCIDFPYIIFSTFTWISIFLGMEEGKYKIITPFLTPFGSSH